MAELKTFQQWSADPNAPLFFHTHQLQEDTEHHLHAHEWGQLLCIESGVLTLSVQGRRLLAPPGFVVWIPGGMQHACYNQKAVLFRSVNVQAQRGAALPEQCCLLKISEVAQAIIKQCFSQGIIEPRNEAEQRLAVVLLDQLAMAPPQHTWLPDSQDKFLSPILRFQEQNPADNTPLSEWARRVYTTERTLSRRMQSELGISFSEWRQRVRFLHALSLLEGPKTIQQIALEVGYSTASAFIAMFQDMAGTTPERFRKGQVKEVGAGQK